MLFLCSLSTSLLSLKFTFNTRMAPLNHLNEAIESIFYFVSGHLLKYKFLYSGFSQRRTKWFIIMLSKLVRQCSNGVGSNPAEGRTKICQLKIQL